MRLTLKKITDSFYIPAALIVVALATFFISVKICMLDVSDLYDHMIYADRYLSGGEYFKGFDYPMFYITYGVIKLFVNHAENAIAITQVLYNVLAGMSVMIVVKMICKATWWTNRNIAFIILMLAFIGPIYSVGSYYLGKGSFNTWHNPGNTCVKFIALLVFFGCAYVYKKGIIDKSWPFDKGHKLICLVLSIASAISLLFKPSFCQVFIPTVSIIVLLDFLRKKIKFSTALRIVVFLLPSLLLILWQARNIFYGGAQTAHGIIISPFIVWRHFTSSVLFSVLLSIAFPLFVVLFIKKSKDYDDFLEYAFVFYIISVLEFAFLAETGTDMFHANFMWGMCVALGVLFLSAIIRFFGFCNIKEEPTRKEKLLCFIGCVLLILHMTSGVWYYLKIAFGSIQCF